ncbi:hypothetical protein A2V82_15780 [candidate division KSB1 bacterium RBG_16_48_16]|nr:MAG: hypothetical protein A2V82_15780 [candidate division KSB1 bacterium RBG_16_48_16]
MSFLQGGAGQIEQSHSLFKYDLIQAVFFIRGDRCSGFSLPWGMGKLYPITVSFFYKEKWSERGKGGANITAS